MNVTIDWLRKKQVKGGGGEFDDSIQLKEVDPASKTVPKADMRTLIRRERCSITNSSNQAMELTAARTAFTFSMTKLSSLRAVLALGSGSSSCSR